MAMISINYAEGSAKKDLGYRSVEILYGSKLKKRKAFGSRDFVVDWYRCIKFIAKNIPEKEPLMESSSIDHFFTDGAYKLYDPATLHVKEGKGVLKYGKPAKGHIVFYVKKRTKPRWAKFRELCGDPIKKKTASLN